MGLKYPSEWRFEGFDATIPPEAVNGLVAMLVEAASGDKGFIESFKGYFGGGGSSSSYDWAVSDLFDLARERSDNAAVFVDGFWKSVELLKKHEEPAPTARALNTVLARHNVPLIVKPPHLRRTTADAVVRDSNDLEDDSTSKRRVPSLVLQQEIGRGGYGVVYHATRKTTVSDFDFAVKILDPSPFVDDYEKALRRFQREVKALNSLQHRGIVAYFEAGLSADNKPYLVMPLIGGPNIRDALSDASPVKVVETFIEVTGALRFAHSKKVLHRDLKPTNVKVRVSDGQPIILDFGSAFILDQMDSQSLTSQAVGTIGYIPSEVLADPKLRSPRHDVYACGVMLYEAVARYRPDPASYRPLADVKPEFQFLDATIQRAIAGVDNRTSSMAALQTDLKRALKLARAAQQDDED